MRSGVMAWSSVCGARGRAATKAKRHIRESAGVLFPSCSQGVSSSSQNVSGDGMMKSIELPAYRAFMFAVVPQIMYAPIGCGIQQAIEDAAALWEAIDAHVLKVAEEIEE